MSFNDLTSSDAVRAAIAEFDSIGREAFLEKYGFGRAKEYFLSDAGKHYDSKAIVGAAYRIQHGVPLGPTEFSGGENTVVPLLQGLGFDVIRTSAD